MKCVLLLGIVACLAHIITAPPVTTKKPHPKEEDSEIKDDLEDYMEYHRYLKEVVQALESDPEFRAKLDKAEEVDIRSGKIAHELDYVNHNVRTKLDEIKRAELERLRHLATKQFELSNDIDTVHAKINSQVEHVDHNNPHTFEIEDLKKLIHKTTADLTEADKQRRDDFKQYEMQKEFEKQQKLQTLDETHRKEFEEELHKQEEKHKKHEPLHHPGSRDQLQEVWKEQDHMEPQDFDPHAFFMLHDVDGNGMWDQTEVKALFLKELDKMYQNGAPEDDMRERQEEMERMREHVFRESDTNGDGLISYEEFLIQTRRSEFEKDQGWKGLDEQQVYSPEEYHEFERRRLEEVQKLIQQGILPPQPHFGQEFNPNQHPNSIPQPAYPPHPGQQQHPPQYYDQQGQYHPNAIPQGQYPPGQYPPQGHAPIHQQQGYAPPPQGQQPHIQQGYAQQPQVHPPQVQGHPQQAQGHPQQAQGHPQQAQGNPPQVQAHHPQVQGHPPQVHAQQQQGHVQQPQGHVQQHQVDVQSQGHIQQQQLNNQQGQPQHHQSQQQPINPPLQIQEAHNQPPVDNNFKVPPQGPAVPAGSAPQPPKVT